MATYYKELIVWQKAIELVKLVYSLTKSFPESETYGLASQMRRAAVSIPSNIAEGQTRRTSADFARFLGISHGSLAELETQMIIARDIGYVSVPQYDEYEGHHIEISKMLTALKTKIANN